MNVGAAAAPGPSNAVSSGRSNRALILREVQRRGAVSRAQLARVTGLTPATITNGVRDLIELQVLADSGEAPPRRRAGAPSTLVTLNRRWHRVLAVHQGVSRIRLGACDLAGAIVASEELAVITGEPWTRTLERVVARLRALQRSNDLTRERVRGVGVGAVGLVDPETGAVRAAPNLGWFDVPLREHLERALGLPVSVRNNVHAMAAAERRLGGLDEETAIYVYVGTGIGSGLLVEGRVFGGSHGAAGEIGHLSVPGGTACSCGKRGCLETVAAEPAVARRAAIGGPHKEAVAKVVGRALAGDREMRRHVRWAGHALGNALAQVAEIVDPSAIVVNGILVEAGDIFLKPLAAQVVARTFAARGRLIAIRPALLGRKAGLAGAGAVALEAFVHDPGHDLLASRRGQVAG